jgi:D-alanine-D-alanine ligase-like ATP-grasp enzyme
VDAESELARAGLAPPLVLKPVRGRGSEGVTLVGSLPELRRRAAELRAESCVVDGVRYPRYGSSLLVEEYLPGTEVTVTVMPCGSDGPDRQGRRYRSLPVIQRTGQEQGVSPYCGRVAVVYNSAPLSPDQAAEPRFAELARHCECAARAIGAAAPVRIDCRASAAGEIRLFDLNLKPNMTGPGRPGRDDQDSLSSLAARQLGWSYADLLRNILRQAWQR